MFSKYYFKCECGRCKSPEEDHINIAKCKNRLCDGKITAQKDYMEPCPTCQNANYSDDDTKNFHDAKKIITDKLKDQEEDECILLYCGIIKIL